MPRIPSSEITPRSLFLRRRELLKLAGGAALLAKAAIAKEAPKHGARLSGVKPNPKYVVPNEKINSFEDITTYNNFYELGVDKEDPSRNASALKTRPWTLSVEGEAARPRTWSIEEILQTFPAEE